MRQQGITGFRGVRAGSCRAWSLPADETCARTARRLFKDAVAQLGLEREVLDDAVLMTSELAANTLHASAAVRTGRPDDGDGRPDDDRPGYYHQRNENGRPDDGGQRRLVVPELWLYLRGLGLQRELVCKVFDGYRGWLQGSPPPESPWRPPQPRPGTDWSRLEPDAAWPPSDPEEPLPTLPTLPTQPTQPTQPAMPAQPTMPTPPAMSADAPSGRGLQIVHALSGGQWGHHPTRARLGGGARGKAVWFAVSAPFAHARLADVTGLRAYTLSADVSAARRQERISARQAARELKAMLDDRGLGRSATELLRTSELTETSQAELSVLSVRPGITLWFRSGAVTLSGPGQTEEHWSYADLVEASEHIIRRYEELSPKRPAALVNA